MEKSQREIALKVVRAYKALSLRALKIVPGIVPIHLLVEERRYLQGRLEKTKTEARERRIRA